MNKEGNGTRVLFFQWFNFNLLFVFPEYIYSFSAASACTGADPNFSGHSDDGHQPPIQYLL